MKSKRTIRAASRLRPQDAKRLDEIAEATGLTISDLLWIGAIGLIGEYDKEGGKLTLPFEVDKKRS